MLATIAATAASLLAVACLGAVATPAVAAEPWGYEQITPADSSSIGVYGTAVSEDMSTVLGVTMTVPMPGMPADGRTVYYHYGLPRAGAPWNVGPTSHLNGIQVTNTVQGMSLDGSRMLYQGPLFSVSGDPSEQAYRVDAQGAAERVTSGNDMGAGTVVASEDLDVVASRGGGGGVGPVFVSRAGQAPVEVSVDNNGAPMGSATLGGSSGFVDKPLRDNALSRDGSSVIFTSAHAIPGDNDGSSRDVFMRALTPGAEKTIAISDANGSGDPDAATPANYRWATADHRRVFFVTSESLEPGDTDGEQDVYMRAGNAAPIRVSQGEVVDGAPTGNQSQLASGAPEWSMSSEDGNRTFFITSERLTQDAPVGENLSLYERDLAEGRTRLVAGPLADVDVLMTGSVIDAGSFLDTLKDSLSQRGIRPTPNGAILMSSAPLAGAGAGPERKIFVWTRDGGLVQVNKPDADAPPSATQSATFLPRNLGTVFETNPDKGGRGVSDDGSRVFFTTAQSLVADDTDGGRGDVYAWTAGEGLSLVTPPGRGQFDATYLDNSPDGREVYFGTNETILSSDTDPGAQDIYMAILGGGSPIEKPVPDADPEVCDGEGCQGPIADRVALPSIGSVGFAGAGNPLASPGPVRASVSVAKLRAVTGVAARLRVRVPNAGRISVSGRSLRRTEKSASKAGTYSVTIALTALAKKKLKSEKTLKVRARVSYRTRDGQTAARTVSVTFKQPKAKRGTTKKGGR